MPIPKAIKKSNSPRPTIRHEVKWVDSKGKHHDIGTMDTDAIFINLTRLWNSVMPIKTAALCGRYRFDQFNSRVQIDKTLRAMTSELSIRQLSTGQLKEFSVISDYYGENLQ